MMVHFQVSSGQGTCSWHDGVDYFVRKGQNSLSDEMALECSKFLIYDSILKAENLSWRDDIDIFFKKEPEFVVNSFVRKNFGSYEYNNFYRTCTSSR